MVERTSAKVYEADPSDYEEEMDGGDEEEEFPEDERWNRFTCPNGHVEKIEDPTGRLKWYCPECGERRLVESNHITPENTKTDKI